MFSIGLRMYVVSVKSAAHISPIEIRRMERISCSFLQLTPYKCLKYDLAERWRLLYN